MPLHNAISRTMLQLYHSHYTDTGLASACENLHIKGLSSTAEGADIRTGFKSRSGFEPLMLSSQSFRAMFGKAAVSLFVDLLLHSIFVYNGCRTHSTIVFTVCSWSLTRHYAVVVRELLIVFPDKTGLRNIHNQ